MSRRWRGRTSSRGRSYRPGNRPARSERRHGFARRCQRGGGPLRFRGGASLDRYVQADVAMLPGSQAVRWSTVLAI